MYYLSYDKNDENLKWKCNVDSVKGRQQTSHWRPTLDEAILVMEEGDTLNTHTLSQIQSFPYVSAETLPELKMLALLEGWT